MPCPRPRAPRRATLVLSPLPSLVVAVALLVGLSAACTSHAKASKTSAAGVATVNRVVDGDTIEVRIGGQLERVRLLGIDTPESVKPGVPPECFSHEASQATATFLPRGSPVDLVRDVEARDDYGRLLAYVYRHRDHTFVNLWLVQQGYAGLLTYPPNVAHAPQLEAATAEARAQHRGLWQACGEVHTRR